MFPDGQRVESDRSDEGTEGEKVEDIVPQTKESLLGTASQETEAGVKEAETEPQPTENVEVEGTASQEKKTEAREAILKPTWT